MTNAEMLTRLERLSTRALKRNAKATEETEVHWKGLAAGELHAKPSCPFCALYDYNCKLCALGVTTSQWVCGVAFRKWQLAVRVAKRRCRLHPLRSKPVRAAAKRMLAHVRRVGRLVRKVLEGRTAR